MHSKPHFSMPLVLGWHNRNGRAFTAYRCTTTFPLVTASFMWYIGCAVFGLAPGAYISISKWSLAAGLSKSPSVAITRNGLVVVTPSMVSVAVPWMVASELFVPFTIIQSIE